MFRFCANKQYYRQMLREKIPLKILYPTNILWNSTRTWTIPIIFQLATPKWITWQRYPVIEWPEWKHWCCSSVPSFRGKICHKSTICPFFTYNTLTCVVTFDHELPPHSPSPTSKIHITKKKEEICKTMPNVQNFRQMRFGLNVFLFAKQTVSYSAGFDVNRK